MANVRTQIDSRFSSPGATAVDWQTGRDHLEQAEVYWISTVRPDGRPHVTPLIGVWLDEAMYFTTGETERKMQNLATNPHVVMTTGCNRLSDGLDVVLEGEAVAVSDEAVLQRLADAYAVKYEDWHFEVRDGALFGEGGRSLVFRVAPAKVMGFGKGDPFSQTRWQFD